MKTWTVIGYYENNGDAFADWVDAETVYQAMAVASRPEHRQDDGLIIVGAVEGRQSFWTPGNNNGSTAAAVDLATTLDNDEDDWEDE